MVGPEIWESSATCCCWVLSGALFATYWWWFSFSSDWSLNEAVMSPCKDLACYIAVGSYRWINQNILHNERQRCELGSWNVPTVKEFNSNETSHRAFKASNIPVRLAIDNPIRLEAVNPARLASLSDWPPLPPQIMHVWAQLSAKKA